MVTGQNMQITIVGSVFDIDSIETRLDFPVSTGHTGTGYYNTTKNLCIRTKC